MTASDRVPFSELKSRLWDSLTKYKVLKAAFESVICARTKRDNWLENPLIQIALMDEQRLQHLEDSLGKIQQHSSELFEQLTHQRKGEEKEFDEQFNDVMAELLWVGKLIDEGYSDIKKLPCGKGESPDISCTKDDKPHLFEIKNLRAPTELSDEVFSKLHAKMIEHPARYGQRSYTFHLSGEDTLFGLQDELNLYKFLEKLDRDIDAGQTETEHRYEKDVDGRKLKIVIHVRQESSTEPMIYLTADNFEYSSNDKEDAQMLALLLKKTIVIVAKAIRQLVAGDSDASNALGVLLKWESSEDFEIREALKSRYRKTVEMLDPVLHEINPRLTVRLY